MTITESIRKMDNHLEYKLIMFEERLNIQMLKLKHGPNYVEDVLDQIIEELSNDKIVGRYEKY